MSQKYIFNVHQIITSGRKFNIFLARTWTKNTAQNTPKHAISSEKFIFLWGVGIAPSSYPSCWKREPPSIALNKPSGSRSTLCSSDFQPDSRHCTSLMLLPDFTGYQHPSTSSLNQWSSSTEPSTTHCSSVFVSSALIRC